VRDIPDIVNRIICVINRKSSVVDRNLHRDGKYHSYVRKVVLLISGLVGVSRVVSNYNNYSGVIQSWTALNYKIQSSGLAASNNTVCVGSEWYAFPAHFFLDGNIKLLFVQDNFHGVLPQYFGEFTWSIPKEPFNDRNAEEKSRYSELKSCTFFVLTVEKGKSAALQSQEPLDLRAQVLKNMPYLVLSKPVIQSSSSPALTRAFFIPYLSSSENVYAEYSVFSSSSK